MTSLCLVPWKVKLFKDTVGKSRRRARPQRRRRAVPAPGAGRAPPHACGGARPAHGAGTALRWLRRARPPNLPTVSSNSLDPLNPSNGALTSPETRVRTYPSRSNARRTRSRAVAAMLGRPPIRRPGEICRPGDRPSRLGCRLRPKRDSCRRTRCSPTRALSCFSLVGAAECKSQRMRRVRLPRRVVRWVDGEIEPRRRFQFVDQCSALRRARSRCSRRRRSSG